MLPSVNFDSQERGGSGRLSSLDPGEASQRDELIGSSPAWRAALERARQAARTGADILLEAERGCGKTLLARFLHRESARSSGPFVAIQCGSLGESILESELFGHPRTSPAGGACGKLALAAGGTLLLDEIGAMPLQLQPRLLRVLQEREFCRPGEAKPVFFDARLIATWSGCLRTRVEDGRFRQDLYCRLNAAWLTLPPLRERGDDVIELAEYFAARFAAPELSPPLPQSFREALRKCDWPGNVRELANTMRRAVTLGGGCGAVGHVLPLSRRLAALEETGWLCPGLSLRQLEKRLLEVTLQATAGNRTHAAELLGVSLRTVRNKIREHGLPSRRQPWA